MAVWRVVARWVGYVAGACVLVAVAGCEGVWRAAWGCRGVAQRGVWCGSRVPDRSEASVPEPPRSPAWPKEPGCG